MVSLLMQKNGHASSISIRLRTKEYMFHIKHYTCILLRHVLYTGSRIKNAVNVTTKIFTIYILTTSI